MLTQISQTLIIVMQQSANDRGSDMARAVIYSQFKVYSESDFYKMKVSFYIDRLPFLLVRLSFFIGQIFD